MHCQASQSRITLFYTGFFLNILVSPHVWTPLSSQLRPSWHRIAHLCRNLLEAMWVTWLREIGRVETATNLPGRLDAKKGDDTWL